jgi:hypothetical protein
MGIAEVLQGMRDAVAELAAAELLHVPPDVGPGVDPPAVIVGAPALLWEGLCGPTSAQVIVWVVVTLDDLSLARLLELVPLVAVALDTVENATVVRADPGTYPIGTSDLPAYQIHVDVAL